MSARFSEDEIDRFAIAIAKALQAARSVSDSEHYDHHKWITKKMKAEEARAEFWSAMADHVAKWGAISLVSALLFALWLGIKQYMGWK